MALCRGRDLRPAELTSKLFCKYFSGYHPMYRIGPLKLEVVSLRPYIVLIHQFIHNSEIREIIGTATPRLRRSEMVGNGLDGTTNDQRVSETAWLQETDTSALANITQRIDAALNLDAR